MSFDDHAANNLKLKHMKKFANQRGLRWLIPILGLYCLAPTNTVLFAQSPDFITLPKDGGRNNADGGVVTIAAPAGGGTIVGWRAESHATNGGVAIQEGGYLSINVGAALLKACDLNHDGKVTLTELKQVAWACFKLWDTNNVGNLDHTALLNGLSNLFPMFQPPPGLAPLPAEATPPGQLTRHLFDAADSNKDGTITFTELSAFLDSNFSQWDHNGDGALDAQELDQAFAQLIAPDGHASGQVFRTYQAPPQQ